MNLRRAILRKAYNNQTFCSYSFKNFKDKYGRTLITISRSSHSSHKLEIETQETIDLSMKASSSHKYKRNVETPHSKICQAEKARRESRDDGKKQKISSSHQLNRFDQYLVDRKFMKQISTNCPKSIPASFTTELEECKKIPSKHLSHYGQRKDPTKCMKIYDGFSSMHAPELFLNHSQNYNCPQTNFDKLILINVRNRKYMREKVTAKLFGDIPMKDMCRYLNQCSNKIQDCLFYCSFLKPTSHQNKYPYCESFFWISQAVKHEDRDSIFKMILKFMANCIHKCKQDPFLRNSQFLNDQVWVVDWRGTMSHINKEAFQSVSPTIESQRPTLARTSVDINLQAICLQMFLNTLHKGTFNNIGQPPN